MDAAVVVPGPHATVYKTECVRCFANTRLPGGVDVCLRCHTAFCDNHARAHATTFPEHSVYVNVREIAERAEVGRALASFRMCFR